MISQTTEYALRAVVYLAQHAEESWTTKQIAAATRVPAGYLSKVLQGLSRAGLINSQRGRHGGFQLTGDPQVVTVLEVINAVEPIRRIARCPLNLSTHSMGLCPLHQALDDTIGLVEKAFANKKLADLLGHEGTVEPLCDFPGGSQFAGRKPVKVTVNRS
jgi:Rrf2 family transcriptional regulator, nitric oxide-sensitive transcriptional repressor